MRVKATIKIVIRKPDTELTAGEIKRMIETAIADKFGNCEVEYPLYFYGDVDEVKSG